MTNDRESVAKIVKRHDAEELQATLRWLAKKAGKAIHPDNQTKYHKRINGLYYWRPLPGANGTLSDDEVTVVLGWLAKAGYTPSEFYFEPTSKFVVMLESKDGERTTEGEGESVNEALANALLALPREDSDG